MLYILMAKLKFPPETDEEFAAWLSYQKKEGLALDVIPTHLKINERILEIPYEVREQIAQSDDFINEMRGILVDFLQKDNMEDYLSSGGDFFLIFE